jgi:hypothetical protein
VAQIGADWQEKSDWNSHKFHTFSSCFTNLSGRSRSNLRC